MVRFYQNTCVSRRQFSSIHGRPIKKSYFVKFSFNFKKTDPLLHGSNDKMFDMTKLKAFADDKLNIAKMTIPLKKKSRKQCWNRRKFWLPAFAPFPKVFSFLFRVIISRDCVLIFH